MAIQFPCDGCGNQLSVPDTAAGKKARCPKCSAVVAVPEQASPSGNGFPGINTGDAGGEYSLQPPEQPVATPSPYATPKPAPRPTDNPYAAPTGGYDEPFAAKPGAAGIRPSIIDFNDIFSHGWNLYLQNVGIVLGAVMVAYLINLVLGWIIGFTNGVAQGVIGDNDAAVLVLFPLQIAIYLIQIAISTFLNIGVWRILLDVGKGQRQDFGKLFSGADIFLPMFAATLLWLLMVIPATMLLIVPGVIVLLLLGQFHFLMVDQGLGVMDSFSTSFEITKRNWPTLLGMYTVSLLIAIACFITCIPLALIFFGPYISMVWTVAYLRMTGQHVASA